MIPHRRHNSPLRVALVSMVGFVIGVVLIFFEALFDKPSFGGQQFNGRPIDFFYENPTFLSWVFFIILQTTVFTSLISPVFGEIKWMKKTFPFRTIYVWRSIGTILILIGIIYYLIYGIFGRTRVISALGDTLNHAPFKIGFMVVFGFFIAGACMVGILCSYYASCLIVEDDKDAVEQYLKIRKYLNTFLIFVGVIVSLSTVATAILQQGLSKICTNNCFPLNFAICYGLFNSLYIALIYVPVYFAIYQKGRKICDHLFADVAQKNLSWKDQQSEQDAIENMLLLKLDFSAVSLKAIPVLAPLIGSIIPGWIHAS
jgi:hypothetical protein